MVDGVADQARFDVLQVEREGGVDDAHAVEHDGQAHLLGGFVDRVVHAVAPERTQAGDGEVHGDEAIVGAVGADLVSGVFRVLGDGQDGAVEACFAADPGVGQPGVVGASQGRRVVDVGKDGDLEQVVREEDGEIDGQFVQVVAHPAGGGHGAVAEPAVWERGIDVQDGRVAGNVQVALRAATQ